MAGTDIAQVTMTRDALRSGIVEALSLYQIISDLNGAANPG